MKINQKFLFGYLPEIVERFGYKKCHACEIYPFKDLLGNYYDICGKSLFFYLYKII